MTLFENCRGTNESCYNSPTDNRKQFNTLYIRQAQHVLEVIFALCDRDKYLATVAKCRTVE